MRGREGGVPVYIIRTDSSIKAKNSNVRDKTCCEIKYMLTDRTGT
jgi:hypothetical protein